MSFISLTRSFSFTLHPLEPFVHVREAHDILVNPIMRRAYDRFGPAIVQACKNCKTNKDYFQHGLKSSYLVYAGLLAALMTAGYFGQGIVGRYWLFLLLASLFALELAMLEGSTSLAAETMEETTDSLTNSKTIAALVFEALTWLIPNRVTFERINILRNVYMSIGMATYKMGHLISPSSLPQPKGAGAIKKMVRQLEEKTILTGKGEGGLISDGTSLRNALFSNMAIL